MSDAMRLLGEAGYMRTKRADKQLELGHDESAIDDARWRQLLEVVRAIHAEAGLKLVAHDLDVTPALLSHRNEERNGNKHPMRDLPYYVRSGGGERIVRLVASWRGMTATDEPAVTPEESLVGLMRALMDRFGPSIVKPLLADAHEYALADAAAKRSR